MFSSVISIIWRFLLQCEPYRMLLIWLRTIFKDFQIWIFSEKILLQNPRSNSKILGAFQNPLSNSKALRAATPLTCFKNNGETIRIKFKMQNCDNPNFSIFFTTNKHKPSFLLWTKHLNQKFINNAVMILNLINGEISIFVH